MDDHVDGAPGDSYVHETRLEGCLGVVDDLYLVVLPRRLPADLVGRDLV
jgi:hypothetical protein